MKDIPLLKAEDIECRVQSTNKSKSGEVGAVLLLYKNARVDMRILDETFGINGWQRTHEVINGNLFCNIDIWDEEKKCWIRKQDVGVPSNTEGEKGEASDAFKRAGFNVGIGRELYTAPFIYVELKDGEWYETNGKIKASNSLNFSVSEISYDESRRKIKSLSLTDSRCCVRFSWSKEMNYAKNRTERRVEPSKPVSSDSVSEPVICADCGAPITQVMGKNGKPIPPDVLVDLSMKTYNVPLCATCQKKRKEAK